MTSGWQGSGGFPGGLVVLERIMYDKASGVASAGKLSPQRRGGKGTVFTRYPWIQPAHPIGNLLYDKRDISSHSYEDNNLGIESELYVKEWKVI